jgi:hypothetical protein
MLAYCGKVPGSLLHCSEELRGDRDVVGAAVALGGLEFQHASRRLQDDPALMRAALRLDSRVVDVVLPGNANFNDRSFMMEAIRQTGGGAWHYASVALQADRGLLLEALASGMRFRSIPLPFQTDALLFEALERRAELYLELSPDLQSDPQVARAAVASPSSAARVHARALELVPRLGDHRDVVLAVAQRGDAGVASRLFLAEGNQFMREDKEVVLAALAKRPSLFGRLPRHIKTDMVVLAAAIVLGNSVPAVLRAAGRDIIPAHPEIAGLLFAVVDNPRWDEITEILMLPNEVIAAARSVRLIDPMFGLWIALRQPANFYRLDDSLLGDEGFMRRALDIHGGVLRYAAPALQSNYSLIVRAIATTPTMLWEDAPVTLEQVENHVVEKLGLPRVFLDFLCGMAVDPSAAGHHVLCRGDETSRAVALLVADFVGVPRGLELEVVREARASLKWLADRVRAGLPVDAPLPPAPS